MSLPKSLVGGRMINYSIALRVLVGAAIVVAPVAASASWLSEITGIDIDIPAGRISIGVPNPAAIPQMLQNLPKDAAQYFLNPPGAALAGAIRISRHSAGGGEMPIPTNIRNLLAPFFPPQILDKVRYNTNKASLSLPAAIQVIDESYAVTLDDLVVFANSNQAQDPVLWAHELTHVMQYDNMGIESFANIYSATAGSLFEGQAREWASRVETALKQQGAIGGPQYSVAPGAFNTPLNFQQFQQVAYQVLPPAGCTVWNGVPAGAIISNSCPIGIVITNFVVTSPYGTQALPCIKDCYVPPRTQVPFGPVPGLVVAVNFNWANM